MNKTIKKIGLIMLSCLCILSSTILPAFAMEENMPSALPNDAVILSVTDNVIVYRSESQAAEDGISPKSMDYAYAWIDATDAQTGSFTIYNSNSGSRDVTMKVEASNGNAYAQMTMGTLTSAVALAPMASNSDGEFGSFSYLAKGNYTISYYCYNNKSGMRLLCWLY